MTREEFDRKFKAFYSAHELFTGVGYEYNYDVREWLLENKIEIIELLNIEIEEDKKEENNE